ncbi:unnamed protein product [Adineta ricciae]|uniref:Uncharacterized protein n=1 Tax=Adineta ricciae TaxID=249248 RepID=A0A815RHA7_ADIRI|nr:unnamed protein product [Adineta ricciae]CAF1477312.1 unnamed protein product [Adineta ricciae]
MCTITQPGDPIIGLYGTKAGGPTGGTNGMFTAIPSETPTSAIDNNVNTKYVNYGNYSYINGNFSQAGQDTGFFVTSTSGNFSVANGIIFATGSDYPERDPLTITLEGTNSTTLLPNPSWTLVYTGATGIDPTTAPARLTYGTLQVFSNSIAFRSYRLLITSQRSYQDSVQYAEAHIMTYC